MNNIFVKDILAAGLVQGTRDSLFEIVMADDHRKWSAIRAIYKTVDVEKYTPYPVDWTKLFSPIENMAWGEIRNFGLPFYPQYPIGKFFADFADPVNKLVIECDGAKFHNKEKDSHRDEFMRSLGWSVFRVSGSDCVRLIASPFDEMSETEAIPVIDEWASRTVDGLVWSLAVSCYGHRTTDDFLQIANDVLRRRSSGVM